MTVKGKLTGTDAPGDGQPDGQQPDQLRGRIQASRPGDLTSWTIAGDTSAVNASKETGNIHSGVWALHYWLDKPFAFTASQTFTGLTSGTYRLDAWSQGGGGEKTMQLYVTCGDATQTVDVVNKGWQQYTQPTIDGIVVTGGTCTVGLKVDAPAGVWGFLDDFEFVRVK